MGVNVLAPDQMVYVDFDGRYCLAENDDSYRQILEDMIEETGHWIEFTPSREDEGG